MLRIFIFTFLLLANTSYGARLHYERDYSVMFCNHLGGKLEVSLSDRGRVDCVTEKEAIELDFSDKWAEGIGQALYYGMMTSKSPTVALIIENHSAGANHVARAIKVCRKYQIGLYLITVMGCSI